MPERAGHGKKSEHARSEGDYYATTPTLAKFIIQNLKAMGINPETVLEPGCGAGTWMPALHEAWPNAKILGYEVHQDLAEYTRARGFSVKQGDLLNNNIGDWQLIVGNPAYNIVDDLIPIFLMHLAPGGHLALLLRMNYVEGQDRYGALYQNRAPAYVCPLPNRPGFIPSGATEGNAYGVFIWTAEPTKRGDTRMVWWDNRLVESRWSHGRKKGNEVTKEDERFPDPRKVQPWSKPIVSTHTPPLSSIQGVQASLSEGAPTPSYQKLHK